MSMSQKPKKSFQGGTMLSSVKRSGRPSEIRPEKNCCNSELTSSLSRGGVSREVEGSLMSELRSIYKMM